RAVGPLHGDDPVLAAATLSHGDGHGALRVRQPAAVGQIKPHRGAVVVLAEHRLTSPEFSRAPSGEQDLPFRSETAVDADRERIQERLVVTSKAHGMRSRRWL